MDAPVEPQTLDDAHGIIQDLRAQLDQLSDFLENGAVGLHWVDRDGHIVWANRAELALLGYTRDEYVGRHIREFHADPHAIDDILQRLARNETLHDYPAPLRAKDGSIKHVVITSNVLWTDGRFVHTRCFTRDMTVAKATEDALRRSELRRQLAMQAARIGTWEYDVASGSVVWTGVEPIHGVPMGSFGGSFDAYLQDVHPDDRERVLASIGAAIHTGAPLQMEYRIVRPDGETRWVRGQGTAALDDTGLPTGMIGVCMDIHDQHAALEAEKAQRQVAEEASRLKDEFLATVSHELRTPLNAIMGWADMLLRGQLKPDRVDHALSTIAANAKRQSTLIEDLLDVSRIVSGKVRLELAEVDIEDVIRDAIDVTAPAADAKDVSVRLEIESEIGPVLADDSRLHQVIWNLLSNAVKFTPAGGRIVTTVSTTGDAVRVCVRDTGIGIAAEFLPFVFAPFRQADATYTRAFGGLGLGLAIAKHVVELHGGTITAQSDGADKGATFTVTLPIRIAVSWTRTERAPRRAGREETVSLPEVPALDGICVLVIDDEEDTREVLNEFLTACGAEVKAAASAAEADRILIAWRPAVMIVDISMAGEDGCSFYERLTRGQVRDRISAVALTAHATPADLERTRAAGFAMHLRKPVELAIVAKIVASLAASDAADGLPS